MKFLTFIMVFSPFVLVAQQSDEKIQLKGFENQVRVDVSERNSTDHIKATSDCSGNVSIDYTDKQFSGGCAGAIERTYILTDDCGNKREVVQYLTLEDNTPPVFDAVPEKEIVLESKLDVQKANSLHARDDSGAYINVDLQEDYESYDDHVELIRTWTAIDPCDNKTTFQQKVIVKRTIPTEEK